MPSPARGLTQPERVEISSRRLLEAAAELIVEKGWEATTAAEIGRRAGYSRAMVHARYGSKDAILEAFLHEYVKRLNPDPDPGTSGMQQVLAHFDRIEEIYTEDRELLRAMFVATFEAVKTTSPLRERVRISSKRRGEGRGGTAKGHRATVRCGPTSTSTAPSTTSAPQCSASPSGGRLCPTNRPRATSYTSVRARIVGTTAVQRSTSRPPRCRYKPAVHSTA